MRLWYIKCHHSTSWTKFVE